MLYVAAFIWWFAGAASFLWLRRGQWTWATVAGAICIWGFVGPLIWICIAFAIIAQAEFWSKPVFGHTPKN